jgi:hypothetical protein
MKHIVLRLVVGFVINQNVYEKKRLLILRYYPRNIHKSLRKTKKYLNKIVGWGPVFESSISPVRSRNVNYWTATLWSATHRVQFLRIVSSEGEKRSAAHLLYDGSVGADETQYGARQVVIWEEFVYTQHSDQWLQQSESQCCDIYLHLRSMKHVSVRK